MRRRFERLRFVSVLAVLLGPLAHGASGAPGGLAFIVGSTNAAPGRALTVPVSVGGFTNIGTLQFSFHFDPTNAAFVDVEQFGLPGLGPGNFGTLEAPSGTLRVSWDDLVGLGQNLADGAILFAVRLTVIGTNIGNVSSVLLDGTPLSVEISTSGGTTITPTLVSGQITITPPNLPPVLARIGNRTVNEGSLLTFTNSATDPDVPAQILTYNLDSGFPAGASIDPASGVFSWLPSEDQGPGTYAITIRVTDTWSPPASASETILVTVNESNSPPMLSFIGDKTLDEGSLIIFSAHATDSDLPLQMLTYTLDPGAPDGADIDPMTGRFTWAPGESQGPGIYSITVRVTDNGPPPLSDSRTFTIIVNEVNTPPTLAPIGPKTVDEGTLLTFTNSATDADLPAQLLTYSLDAGFPAGASIDPTNGVFTWVPTEAQGPGTYQVTIRFSDDFSPPGSAARTITVTVNEVNTPPVLPPFGNKTVDEGSLLTFAISATDADLPAQSLTYSLDPGFPAGAAINPTNGVFTWVPTEAQGPGSYPVTIRVSDDFSPPADAAETIFITVNEVNTPPVLAHIGNKTVDEGTLLIFTNSATDADLPAQTLSYSLAPGFPAGASIDPTNGLFTWVPTEAQGPGSYTVTIQVSDDFSPPGVGAESITITVNEINTPPVLSHIGDKTVDEGTMLIFTNSGTDSDLPAQALTYSLDPGFPSGATINSTNGVFTWIPTEAQGPGVYQVTVRVADDFSPPASAAETITITVNEVNTPPVLAHIGNKTVDEGILLTFTNSATDADLPPQSVSYSLDGGFPAGAAIDPMSGVFTWTPTEAQGPGSYPVTIRVSDSFSPPASAAETITITVNEVNTPPVLPHIGDKTVDEGTLLTFTNLATDAELPFQTLTYTLDGGAPSGASISATKGVFTWTPSEVQGPGIYAVTVRVTDNGSPPASVADTISITVNEVNTPPVLSHIGDKTINEGTLLTFTNLATDADLPAQSLTYSLDAGFPAGAAINATNCIFTWTPTEAQGPGSYPVTIRVSDSFANPGIAAETITITVNEVNSPPALAPIANQTVDENTPLSFTNSATDSDLPAQTLAFSLDPGYPAGASIDAISGVFSWIPTEAQGPGTYPVTVRVTDNGSPASSAAQTLLITVNEVNTPPSLGAVSDQTIDEGKLLSFTNTAMDIDLPAQTLAFSLDPGAPAGASINSSNGVFSWRPTKAQGPGSYPITIRVTDSGAPPGSASQTITITVNEINTPPLLATRGDQTVNEGVLLAFTNLAADADLPLQTLTFSLDPGFPAGASINPSNGFFSWTPAEAQGPAVYPVTIRVTDSGTPPASAAQTIFITVNEVNTAPTLSQIGDKTVTQCVLLSFIASATDSDLPAQTLIFSLDPGAPLGAGIDGFSGLFTWAPKEAQRPGVYQVTIRVTDSGSPPASAAETINITVTTPNLPPIIAPIPDQIVTEGTLLSFTVAAASGNTCFPGALSYRLAPGAPPAAAIDPTNGLFTWLPPEVPAPLTNTITVIVTENASPSLTALQSFNVAVIKGNSPPVFLPLGNFIAEVLLPLKVTNIVSDPDIPTNRVTFAVVEAPKGARINKFTGILVWAPARNQARTTNTISVSATDDGVPPLSATNSFVVIVEDYAELSLGQTVVRTGQAGSVPIYVTNSASVTNLTALLYVPPAQLGNVGLSGLAQELQSAGLTPEGPGLWQLSFAANPGQIFQPGQLLAQLNVTALSNQPSAFVPLTLSNLVALQTNGGPVARTLTDAGRVVVVGQQPLVEVLALADQAPLILYGNPGFNYVIESATAMDPHPNWQPIGPPVTLTTLSQTNQLAAPLNSGVFFRSVRP